MIVHLVYKKQENTTYISGTTGKDGSITRDIVEPNPFADKRC